MSCDRLRGESAHHTSHSAQVYTSAPRCTINLNTRCTQVLTTQCTLQCRKVTKVYQSFKMQIYLISANKMCKLYDLFRVLHIICRKLRMLAMCSELCKHYPAVQCTDNAVRSALHIALRRMQLCTVVHCTENAWCARDRKWRRGVRAVASWTPSRAHRPAAHSVQHLPYIV